ncbi:MAG: TlpA family protein disulfide reductase [Bacteroidetes bacterium]|nr:TlpA family protein disulfide reductase [Bacteroidota bacterium]MBL7104636.1 TlpA family protein disulfide reductase [Bacteroidales bacterium]
MKYSILLIFLTYYQVSLSQEYNLKIQVQDIPEKEIYLAGFYGDQNHILDTAVPDTTGLIYFTLKESYYPGMYRIFLDKNIYFDIIYNHENIEIKTQYNFLYDSLKVISSKENMIYYDFLRANNEYRRKFDLLAPLVDYYPQTDTFYNIAKTRFVNIQEDFVRYVNEVIESNPDAWATKIFRLRQPLFFDPELDEAGRREYATEHFFDHIDFTDVELIRSNAYTSLAIEYMSIYSNPNFTQEQLEESFIQAVDKIMYEAMDNNIIYEFIVDYLVGGFERFHFEKVLDYIAENYSPEQCKNEERKTDLQTRLIKYAELAKGKKAPEIVIPDINGEQIKLSKINSEYTLILFWASWCPHCNEVLPKIHNIYVNSVSRNTLEVLSVSLDTEKEEWLAALQEANYTWIDCSELKGWDSQVAIDYNIYATPTMFLLDKNKKIVAKPITFNELKNIFFKENIIR